MPVGFNSPARNLFLLGSTGAQLVSNFFKTIDRTAGTDSVYLPDEIKYNVPDQKYILAGTASDSQSKDFGWFEKRDEAGVAEWETTIQSTLSTTDTTLRALEIDNNDNLIVVGKTGSIPWVAKYTNGGSVSWQSTTSTADLEYSGIAIDSNNNIYACGNTPTPGSSSQAFIEKFDSSGVPGWGKSAFMLGRDVILTKCAANSRGEVVAVGFIEDDSAFKGYVVKINANTGEVLWDRTIRSYEPDISFGYEPVFCEDVYIDADDQIYIVGRLFGISETRSFIIKYTAEGNMLWQRETPAGETIQHYYVKSDTETEQTIVYSQYFGLGGMISKYSKNGDLVFRRVIYSSFNSSTSFGPKGLDADPSNYYLLFVDDPVDLLSGDPKRYTFGKVSSSGNGLGNFTYSEGTGQSVYYQSSSIQDKIGRLSDGSVRQDTSDLLAYPFSANKLLFDDLATQVANKKRQMDSADSFEYSGSPAIRPADFQELNLLGDVYSGTGNWLDQSNKNNDGKIYDMWFKCIVGSSFENLSTIDVDNYGNYYSSGITTSQGQGSNDGLITKWDSDGNLIWQRIIGGAGNDNLNFSLVVDKNTNHIYAGSLTTSQSQGSNDAFITKWDSDGNLIWQRIIGGAGGDNIRSFVLDSSGNLYCGGLTTSQGQGGGECLLLKIDPNGNPIWQRILGSTTGDVIVGLIVDKSDNIYAVGYSNFVNPNANYMLTKWDTSGNLIWQKKLDIPGSNAQFNKGFFDEIGNYIYITGYDANGIGSGIGAPTGSLSKFDLNGNLIWHRIIGISGTTILNDVYVLDSNNIFAVGFTTSQGSNDGFITKWDSDGNLIWQRIIGGAGNDTFSDIYVINNDYIVLALSTNSINSRNCGAILQLPINLYPLQIPGGIFNYTESTLSVFNYSPEVTSLSLILATSSLVVATSTLTVSTSTLDVTTIVDPRPTYNASEYWGFDGVDDYMNVGDLGIDMSEFTVEVWFKPSVVENYRNVLDCNYGTPDPADGVVKSGNIGPRLEMNSAGNLAWNWGASRSANDPFFSANVVPSGLTANTWHHAVLVVNGNQASNGKTYYNGSLVSSSGTQMSGGSTSWYGEFKNVNLGRGFVLAGNRYFNGKIGEVRIYPRALTAAQVYQNYNATNYKYGGRGAVTAPKLIPGIVFDSSLRIHLDFKNALCYSYYANSNLLTYSDYSSANVAQNTTITLNATIAPDGSNTAISMDGNTGTSMKSVYKEYNANPGAYTTSVYAKYKSERYIALGIIDSTNVAVWAIFDILNGVISEGAYGSASVTNKSFSITSSGNGWYRLSVSGRFTTFTNNLRGARVWLTNYDTTPSTNGVYLWGPQLSFGSNLLPYLPTRSTAITPELPSIRDLSSYNYPLSASPTAVYNASNGRFDFNGNQDNDISFTSGYPGSGYNDPISIETWFIGNYPINSSQVIGTVQGTTTAAYWLFMLSTNGAYNLTLQAIGTTYGIGTTTRPTPEQGWKHFVATYNGGDFSQLSSWKIYVNGVSQTTQITGNASVFGPGSSANATQIGTISGGTSANRLSGSIGQYRVYHKALTASEVSRNFNATRSRYGV